MKRLMYVAVLAIILIFFLGFATFSPRLYNADFLAEFSDTFDVMFDGEWAVLSADRHFFVPPEFDGVKPTLDRRPQRFRTWTISIANVNIFLLNATVNSTRAENQEFVRAIATYRRLLDTPEGTIPLGLLTPYNMFKHAPMYLSVSINIHEDIEISLEKIENMLDDLNDLTANRLNASVQIAYRPERIDYRRYFIRGERRESSACDFQRHVFEGHRGVFW
ncbi:MAG: hypothetical protein FWF80_06065 [Defluviitaleaceae bacterium]|nr:hypothetical protein [Defluviitaleaceae bacterium]